MGLVNHVVPHAELEATVREMAETIAANAPLSIMAAKHTVNEMVKDRAERDDAANKAVIERAMASDDFKEGRKAFLEKRKPVWQGR